MDATEESGTPGQHFLHPTDDKSYFKDMWEDEMLAKAKPSDNGKVRYISHGIAISGMRAMDAEEHAYNLKMLFVSQGEYLTNVDVNITDSNGDSVLNTVAKGAILLISMPPGHYTVMTKAPRGSALTRHVEVGGDHIASYVLRYPAKEQS